MMQRWHSGSGVQGDERGIDIIVIPGFATPAPEEWRSSKSLWMQDLLREPGCQFQMWTYKSLWSKSSGTLMRNIDHEANRFLVAVKAMPKSTNRIPIVFLCHSLGGLVLKKALCIARQHHFSHREVIDVIYGIIFLGVPHSSSATSCPGSEIQNILRSRPKQTDQLQFPASDQEEYRALCHQYDNAGVRIRTIDAYEKKETPLPRRFREGFWKQHTALIIGAATTLSSRPQCKSFGVDEDHDGICRLIPGTRIFLEIQQLLRDVADEAPKMIEDCFSPYTGPQGHNPLTLKSDNTPASVSAREQELDGTNHKASVGSQPVDSQQASNRHLDEPSLAPVLPDTFEPQKLDPKLPLFSVSTVPPNPDFFGRFDVLKTIDEHLLPSTASTDRPLRSFGICGMGGLGKTQIAIQYVHTRRSHFNAIFWLSADDPLQLLQHFASIATQLGIEPDEDHGDLVVSRERVKEWLSVPFIKANEPADNANEANWLLVFDNADNLSVLEDYWPKTGKGAVLITSRDPVAKTSLYTDAHGIDLEKMSLEDSIDLLRSLTKQTADDDNGVSLRKIAEILDGLPLGIEQMAGIIRQLRVSYSDFSVVYEKESKRLYAMTPLRKDSSYQYNLRTVWSLEKLSESSETLLQVLATLHPDSVPEAIFTQHPEKVNVAGFPTDMIKYYSARAELTSASLISLTNQEGNQKVLSLHRLLQDVVRSRMEDNRFGKIFEASLQLIVDCWPFQILAQRHRRVDRWQKCEELLSQVSHLKRLSREVELKRGKPLSSLPWIELLDDVGFYLFERGLIEEAQEYFKATEIACNASEERASERIQYLLRQCQNNIGTAANEANDFPNAVRHFEIWRDMCLQRRTEGGDLVEDYEYGIMFNELAVAQAANGDTDSAIQSLHRNIEIFKALPDYKETWLAWPVSNLGFLYKETGETKKGEEMCLRLLDVLSAAGDKSFLNGKIMHALGNIYAATGEEQKSLHYHLLAQSQYRTVLGDTHARTAAVCHRLADHYIALHRFNDAKIMLEKALKVFGSRKFTFNELARTTFKMSQFYMAQGFDAEAKRYQEKAYQMWQDLVKGSHRPMESVGEDDYDNLIIFWNR